MVPLMVITDSLVEIPPKIITREAVRAVVIHENLILLMYSNTDQMYGTPGGGIILNESKFDTLHRELLEEIGATQVKIIENLGYTEEIRESRSLYGKVAKIITDYYHVDVMHFISSKLEDYEEEMGLIPMWVKIDEAIRQNQKIRKSLNLTKINFYYTQTEMLKYIKSRFGL
ncbi:MAG: NUDIX domain-containing protein [Candidatus Izemoplasmatales bacterium]|nr:NUDIX domain-containing protein [Candidatus Izemoplasmatales bacterium]